MCAYALCVCVCGACMAGVCVCVCLSVCVITLRWAAAVSDTRDELQCDGVSSVATSVLEM